MTPPRVETVPPGELAIPHTVLVVDDQASNRTMAKVILEAAGHRVVTADGGRAALRLLETERPSLVLLDYVMPEMDGAEVARAIRQHQTLADVPITMLTSSGSEEDIEAAFAAGANDYITKPVDRRILTARVRAALQADADRRRATRHQAVRAQRDALMREIEEARRVQRSQLPPVPASWPSWEVSGTVVPCGQVGGDAFDLFNTNSGSRVIALVDVSGHGIAAAMMTAMITSQLRTLLRTRPLEQAFAELNEHLCASESGLYACIGAIEMQPDRALVINAGLPPICGVLAGQSTRSIDCGGPPPGLIESATYDVQEVRLERGERLFMVSDGITEPFGNADEVLPVLRRLELLAGAAAMPQPYRLGSSISALFEGRELPDDATVVVVERTAAVTR